MTNGLVRSNNNREKKMKWKFRSLFPIYKLPNKLFINLDSLIFPYSRSAAETIDNTFGNKVWGNRMTFSKMLWY